MKQTNVKRAISFMMSLLLVLVFTISAGASAPNETYIGTIVIDENSSTVDLSDIEIQVFSAEPVYDAETKKLLYYGETYAFSVYTNENGEFSFVKPTEFCSVTISLESLPIGFGIERRVQFIVPGVTHHTYVLSEIAEIDVQMEYEQITASFYDENGKRLNVEHQIEESSVTMETLSSQQIKQMASYDRTGKVITPNGEFSFSFPIDLSDYSLQTKAEYFYTEGLISEEKKIDVYCDIVLDETSNVQQSSNSTMVKEILAYKNQVLEKKQVVSEIASTGKVVSVQNGLIEKIDQASQMVSTNSFVNWAKVQRVLDGGFGFTIYYDSTDQDLQAMVGELADMFSLVYDYFVMEMGFNAPISHTNSYYEITYENDLSDPLNGETIYYLPKSGSSYITINYAQYKTRNEMEHTVAHEFHHAIMATYGFNTSSCQAWVREGFSNMAGMIYTNRVLSSVKVQMKNYLQKSYLSLYDESGEKYGTMLYPLYIYENLGGWNTIKQIYNNFSVSGNIYTAITNCTYISGYDEAFVGMYSNNYKPTAFYSRLNGVFELDNVVPMITCSIGIFNTVSIVPMAGCYLKIESIDTAYVGSLEVSCEIINGSGSGIYIDKITDSGDGNPVIESKGSDFTKITFSQHGFGNDIRKLVIVGINTNYTETEVLCKIDINEKRD